MISLIDLAGDDDVVGAIEKASRDIGFMYVAGHGISPRIIERARSTVVDYFALSPDVKMRDRIDRDNYRGYIPLGFFNANTGHAAGDRYEGYKLHFEVGAEDPICEACGLYGPNKWPEQPAHFKRSLLEYWRECDRVAAILLSAYAQILGIDESTFLHCFEQPLTNMTLLHYPPQAANDDGIGIHPHKDTDALTILVQDPVGGLQVRRRGDREWLDAKAPGDALIVNIGDLLELWSGGYFVSTPHRVVNTSGAERYSFPYFAVPRYDTIVRPLRFPQSDFVRESVHVGDVSKEVWRTNWPDTMPSRAEFDLGTLEN